MFLHDMFYPECKPITDYSVFNEFMFIKNPIQNTNNILIENQKKEEENKIQKLEKIETKEEIAIISRLEKECVFTKNVQDGLFWSMFICHYGYTEYNRNKYNYGKIEVQEKEKIAEYLHKNGSPKISKQTNYKLTRGFCCEIESDLITNPKMPFSGLIGMCAYYHCDIIVIDLNRNIYHYFSGCMEDDDTNTKTKETYILYKNPLYTGKYKSNEYFIDIDHKIYSLSEIKERFFQIDNYQKPMKSITNYKKIELEIIAKKTIFHLNNNEKPLIFKEDKQQLYEMILTYISTN
jgi:hypothetical protein